ncbi:putative bifunctional diguanylate cyclase/phosphodiesterase [Saccharibacillus alkalitolerans]|uniref:Bifunctional diguanylate cyclase/phosphodiesterase n=1 Tax=Saccharibacillus alkalitolerans TaxID=2705290 RepID=A0ABX0F482_9BACL|nr:bifunctional diguanylate cyclase/phosphodiesterase [Saccharibacillus alkalitolerans]NGZ75771.1 bifunctional diguanylate cyclase/phosphodiesterase [Saccharibacillus alkalitolerans]
MYKNRYRFYAGTVLYLIAYYVLLNAFRGNESVMGWLGNLLNLLPAAAGAFILWGVARKADVGLKRFWRLLMYSSLAYALAMCFWLWDAMSESFVMSLPSPADYLWFAEGILICSALLLLNYKQLKGLNAVRLLLDASIFMTTMIALSWILLIEPLYAQAAASGSLAFMIMNVSYPIEDLGFLFLLILLMLSNRYAIAVRAQQMLLAAVMLFIVGDSIYLYLLTIDAYAIGSFIDPVWSMSLIAIALSGIESLNPKFSAAFVQKTVRPGKGWLKRLLPYVSLGTLMVIMLLQMPDFNMIVLCCITGILLVTARQILTLAENDELLARLGQYLKVSDRAAHHDELTGLPNRRLFSLRLQEAIVQAEKDRAELAVVFMDFNRFKYINDTLGHGVGDRMLQEAAARFEEALPGHCLLARLGGDEFVILIPRSSGTQTIRSVIAAVEDSLKKPMSIDEHSLHVSTSIGIAVYPADGSSMDELLKNADAAMYRSKKNNGSKAVFFDSSIGSELERRLEIENDLNNVIERNELSLHYQLQVHARTGRIAGVEALLRWKHPVKGYISPADFIPIAEETGAIKPIGEWVLRQACMQQRKWARSGLANLRMSVNVSPRQLQDDHIVESFLEIVRSAEIDPRMLVLEITETFAVNDIPVAVERLSRLRQAGIRVAIDDFGSGYASLKYLKNFKPSLLKIDRGFIACIRQDDEESADMVRAIISLGHSLKIEVLAEGVETPEQLEFLREAGCDEMQGYLIGRPIPESELTERLQTSPLYFMPPDSISS